MLTVISPAKSLDWAPTDRPATPPRWQAEAARLARTARQLSLRGLRGLMDISEDLARLNRARFRDFSVDPPPGTTRPAALAFDGETYRGLRARTLSDEDLAFAQDRLRILSGLYGVLAPLDAIQPYRLEMGSRLHTRRGSTLYAWWGDRIAKALCADAQALGCDTLLNCASAEYFAAADRPALKLRVITAEFREVRGDRAPVIGVFAKRARGAMARFAIVNRLTDPDGLKDFAEDGYRFDPGRSDGDRWVFSRASSGQGASSAAS